MDSPQYGEQMGRHWLDVARYADTHGLHLDNERQIWPYRDWVVRAFNRNLPFDQFMSKAAPKQEREVIVEDLTKATVRKELDQMRAAGAPVNNGVGRQVLQGMTFGLADEALAGLSTPLEMIKRRTFNPVEGYNYAKAREDLLLEDARKRGGIGGTVAEMAGGVLTGGQLAKGCIQR
jgi:hypothetical protein